MEPIDQIAKIKKKGKEDDRFAPVKKDKASQALQRLLKKARPRLAELERV